jgi:UDP-N-acetylmuramate dehydrogenase
MRIGGTARYYAELQTKADVEEAVSFVREKNIPLLPFGSGSNTVFNDAETNALVVRLKEDVVRVDGNRVTVGCGKNLAMLINELGAQGLDLSALTGIPGTVGGAIFGNAGQGPKGTWIDAYVESVGAFFDGTWKLVPKAECGFAYRESVFKHESSRLILWEVTLNVPSGNPADIKANVESLLKKRIETQPHLKTAGSCFKAIGGTPAWQSIDAAGLRGYKVGGVEISQKHANFLINAGEATYGDAVAVVEKVKQAIPQNLEVEMRFIEPDGSIRF